MELLQCSEMCASTLDELATKYEKSMTLDPEVVDNYQRRVTPLEHILKRSDLTGPQCVLGAVRHRGAAEMASLCGETTGSATPQSEENKEDVDGSIFSLPTHVNVSCLCLFVRPNVNKADAPVPNEPDVMPPIVKAVVYCIFKHCLKGILVDDCQACLIDHPGQRGHTCLSGGYADGCEDVTFAALEIYKSLSLARILSAVLYTARCLGSYTITNDTERCIKQLLKNIIEDRPPYEHVHATLEQLDEKLVDVTFDELQKKHYSYFYRRKKKDLCKM
nr:PREDICTED: DNA excision repair protein ERCC-6-like isoform X2 [Lepisosteus oculatus]